MPSFWEAELKMVLLCKKCSSCHQLFTSAFKLNDFMAQVLSWPTYVAGGWSVLYAGQLGCWRRRKDLCPFFFLSLHLLWVIKGRGKSIGRFIEPVEPGSGSGLRQSASHLEWLTLRENLYPANKMDKFQSSWLTFICWVFLECFMCLLWQAGLIAQVICSINYIGLCPLLVIICCISLSTKCLKSNLLACMLNDLSEPWTQPFCRPLIWSDLCDSVHVQGKPPFHIIHRGFSSSSSAAAGTVATLTHAPTHLPTLWYHQGSARLSGADSRPRCFGQNPHRVSLNVCID